MGITTFSTTNVVGDQGVIFKPYDATDTVDISRNIPQIDIFYFPARTKTPKENKEEENNDELQDTNIDKQNFRFSPLFQKS